MDWTSGVQFLLWPEILDMHFRLIDRKSSRDSRAYAHTIFSNAHLFLILGEKLPTFIDLKGRSFSEPLSLPFQTCVFECLSNITLDIKGGFEGSLSGDADFRFNFLGVHEVEPGSYWFFGAGIVQNANHHTKHQIFMAHHHSDDPKITLLAKIMKARIAMCLELINQESSEVGRVTGKRLKLKMKMDGKKEFVKFRPITVIRPKAVSLTPKCESIERRVDWSHRWEVRGHWRRIHGLGKNREGVYCIKGMTWVKDFTKGDESLPLIKKTRILTGTHGDQ